MRLVPGFAINSVRHGSSVVVEVLGEVDLFTARWLAEELRVQARSEARIVVDLQRVEFMDCSGLRVLLEAAERDTEERFSVTPGSRQVQRLFDLTGAAQRLRFVAPPSWSVEPAAA